MEKVQGDSKYIVRSTCFIYKEGGQRSSSIRSYIPERHWRVWVWTKIEWQILRMDIWGWITGVDKTWTPLWTPPCGPIVDPILWTPFKFRYFLIFRVKKYFLIFLLKMYWRVLTCAAGIKSCKMFTLAISFSFLKSFSKILLAKLRKFAKVNFCGDLISRIFVIIYTLFYKNGVFFVRAWWYS